ncbi:hypothetical protein CIB95_09840 [Lottiidibacillus patelloidae]|uniref:Uncharacterized protein n=1 Tax=Lottiidibacillus patelloidae TaxID=2670334 RepID=A0A263BUQ7_9BACI|nr:hypothetical protein CIB95_09840 [Lottiidibacillus patelloidae]
MVLHILINNIHIFVSGYPQKVIRIRKPIKLAIIELFHSIHIVVDELFPQVVWAVKEIKNPFTQKEQRDVVLSINN